MLHRKTGGILCMIKVIYFLTFNYFGECNELKNYTNLKFGIKIRILTIEQVYIGHFN
jgi:hypothetical protein